MESKELPAEMLTAVTHEILRQKVMGFVDAQGVLEAAGVPGLLEERDEAQRQAALHRDMDHFNHKLLEKARAALAVYEEKFDAIYDRMGGDECDGWSSPEDVWQLALDGRTEVQRVLGKEAEA